MLKLEVVKWTSHSICKYIVYFDIWSSDNIKGLHTCLFIFFMWVCGGVLSYIYAALIKINAFCTYIDVLKTVLNKLLRFGLFGPIVSGWHGCCDRRMRSANSVLGGGEGACQTRIPTHKRPLRVRTKYSPVNEWAGPRKGAWLQPALCSAPRHAWQDFRLDQFYGRQENQGKSLIYTFLNF